MNIGISHINLLDPATLTYSTQHASFPATNVQHRWCTKPWRSRHGSGSTWGLFRVTAATADIHFGEQKLVDGELEVWASATDLTNWTEAVAGTSTVNRESTIKKYGSYSCRFTVDGASSNAQISQNVVLVADASHRIGFWHYTPIGRVITFRLTDSANNVYLKSDATWTAAVTYISDAGTGAWKFYYLDFKTHAAYVNYTLSIYRGGAMVSQSQYIDDIALTQSFTAELIPGDYNTTTLCAEAKTQMDAAGALTYTVTYSETTNKFMFAATGKFVFYTTAFVLPSNAAWGLLGYPSGILYDLQIWNTQTAWYVRIHSEEELMFDLGADCNLYFFALKNHNLQSTATITLIYYSDAGVTESGRDTVTWVADILAKVLNQNQRYVKLHIVDRDNPDLYIEIGRPWLGVTFQPRIGFSMERTRVKNDPSVIAESENGQESTIQRTKYATWNYTFEGVDPYDAADVAAIFDEIGASRPMFICEDLEAADITPYTKYVRLTDWEEPHIAGAWWSLEVGVKEER